MSDAYILFAFTGALILMVLAISRWKFHPALTLLFVVIALGLALGMSGASTVELVNEGFGSTIGQVGLIIFLGCVLGKLLEGTGAAERITHATLSLFGQKRIIWAIVAASAVLGIPIFSDAVVVVLMPLVSQLAVITGTSMAQLGTVLYLGAYITSSAVPPTPGPLAAAAFLDVDIARAISWGSLICIPGIIAGTIYVRFLKIQVLPKPEYVASLQEVGSQDETGDDTVDGAPSPPLEAGRQGGGPVDRDGTAGPDGGSTSAKGRDSTTATGGSAATSTETLTQARSTSGPRPYTPPQHKISLIGALTPLMLPIVMIMVGSFGTLFLEEGTLAMAVLGTIGNPVIALLVGVISAFPLLGDKWKTKEVRNDWIESGLRMAAMPIMVTGIGGALALIVRETGVAENLAASIGGLGIQPILIPMIIAALVNIVTGSNTLGVLTAAAIMQPLLGQLGLTPMATFLACASGAQIFKHPNSSGFWVTVSLSNMDVAQGIRAVGGATAVGGLACSITTYVLYSFGLF